MNGTRCLFPLLALVVLPPFVAVAGTARVEMTVVDERGEPVKEGLFIFSRTGDPGRTFSIAENEAGRYADSVDLPEEDATWQLTKIVVEGHLPVKLSFVSRSAGGDVFQEASGVNVGMGSVMPPIPVVAGGSVKIELILGERTEVMARFSKARAEARAEAVAAQARQEARGPGRAEFDVALRSYQEGDLEGALQHFAEAGRQAPDDAEIHVTYANVLYRAKRHAEFDRAAQAALRLDPQNREMWMMLYGSRRARGEMKPALEALLAVKALGSGGGDLLKHFDFVAKTMGSTPDTIPAYEAILDLDEKNLDARVALAVVYAEAGRMDRSAEYLEQAVELAPDQASIIHLDLGSRLLGKKKLEEDDLTRAIELIRKAIDLDPRLAPAYKKLGLALWKRKDYAGTRRAFEKYLELSPNAEDGEQIADYLSQLPKLE